MKYSSRDSKLKSGMKVWACAYEFDNNKTTMGLIQRPIYGMLRGYGWSYENDGISEEKGYPSFFVPFKKGSETEFAKSKSVSIYSRVFADTYDECVGLYNSQVNERVEWFRQRAEETEKDLLVRRKIL